MADGFGVEVSTIFCDASCTYGRESLFLFMIYSIEMQKKYLLEID